MSLPVGSMGMLTTVADDFSSESRSEAAVEGDCTEDMPVPASMSRRPGGLGHGTGFRTVPIELAFVVDDTGSMGPEIAGVRAALTAQIQRLAAVTTRPYRTPRSSRSRTM